MELSIVNHKPKFSVGHQNKESKKDEDFDELTVMELMIVKAVPVKFPPSERRSESLQSQHTPHYKGWPTLDDEDTACTNIASVTPTNDMHDLENKQKALPSPPTVPPKLRLNNFEPIQMEVIPSESNADEFNKLTIGEVPTSGNLKPKMPSYSPVFLYVARSGEKDK
ncbi:UNVERIFIED_CONTAM: hypothetical protein Sradi_2033900 [Sesamum radiatum]|uniref:Uncharacterized protein n=1 Tax=Sesamum radiatum TaxID=300843 RepID=A0AAW2TJS5_SESRA